MKNKKIKKVSLLLDLEKIHYDAVKDEIMAIEDGVQFHYAIDHDQVVRFVLPFQQSINEITYGDFAKTPNSLLNTERYNDIDTDIYSFKYVADEQFILNYLFNVDKSKLLILDEYIIELTSFITHIRKSGDSITQNADLIDKYLHEFNELGILSKNKLRDLKQLVGNNISLLVSYSTGLLKAGVEKLISIIREKKIAIEINDFPEDEQFGNVQNILADYRETSKRHDEIKNYIFSHIKNYKFENAFEKEAKYLAVERDCQAIDRLFTLNDLLESAYKNGLTSKRHIFLYVSSTDNSERLFYQNDTLRKFFPLVNKKRINILRNNAQLFLKFLCSDNRETYSLNFLQEIEDKMLELKRFESVISSDITQTHTDLLMQKHFGYSRESLENYSLLAQFDNYKSIIIAAKTEKNLKAIPSVHLIAALDMLIDLGEDKKQALMDMGSSLENVDIWFKFRATWQKTLQLLTSFPHQKKHLISDSDYIKAKIHHLPILYICDEPNFKSVIDELGEYIVQHTLIDNKTLGEILTIKVQSFLEKLEPSLEEKLLRAFFFLILPNNRDFNNTRVSLEWAKNILNNEIITSKTKKVSSLERDYRYLIIWAQRRDGDFNMDFIKSSISLFDADPRFYHGESLTYYCIFRDKKRSNKKQGLDFYLLNSISSAKKALQLYKKRTGIFSDILLEQTINAIYNTIAYCYVELYIYDNNIKYIQMARRYIKALKKGNLVNYERYAEYLHTEAHLELFEAKCIVDKLFNEPQLKGRDVLKSKASLKLNNSDIAISKAIVLLETENSDMQDECNELALQTSRERTRLIKA